MSHRIRRCYAGSDIFRYMVGDMPYCRRKAAENWLALLYPTDWATPSTLREESRSNSAARSILRCCSQVWTGSPYRRRNPSLNVVAERQARRLKVDMERGSSRLSSIYRRVSAKVRIIS